MSLSKNFNHYKKCVSRISVRHLHSTNSKAIDSQKMQARNVVLSQWKLINQLKDYIVKLSPEKTLLDSALNKEFALFLQKIQPRIYGSDLVKYFQSLPATTDNEKVNNETEQSSISSVFNGIKMKIGNNSKEKKAIAKWRDSSLTVSKESVASSVCQILFSLVNAKTDDCKLSQIEDLNARVNKYPEAKHAAVKEGAIRLLLKINQDTTNSEIKEMCNETLVLLGYNHPVSGRGIRILSIDGGGVRGILVLEMLKKLEELTGKSIREMFDLVCGVSTGAIIASIISTKSSSLDEVSQIYKDISTQVFTQSPLKGTSNLVWSHSYYDTVLWEKLLKEQFAGQTLISTARDPKTPKLCALSAVVNQSRLSAYTFRNYTLPCRVQSQYIGSHKHLVWEAVRASAAAPTYFEEFKLGNLLHQDGGILINNPTAVALHEAKLLWPETPIQCVISFGTGRTVQNPVDVHSETTTIVNNSSWKAKFYAIIESATDTEGVNTMLSDLFPANIYYRFNPYLTEMLDIAEIDPVKLEQLKRDAVMYLRRNEDKFQEAAKVLSYEKSFTQKVVDWLKVQGHIHGLKQKV